MRFLGQKASGLRAKPGVQTTRVLRTDTSVRIRVRRCSKVQFQIRIFKICNLRMLYWLPPFYVFLLFFELRSQFYYWRPSIHLPVS